jgi:hypothetical protein
MTIIIVLITFIKRITLLYSFIIKFNLLKSQIIKNKTDYLYFLKKFYY